MTVLDARTLNRATLARQHLLTRADGTTGDAVRAMVGHLCGVQAQEPQEPFVGLWSRLSGFEPTALDAELTGRTLVRVHLMRRTVHLVTAADMLAWRARHDAMLRQRVVGVYRRELDGLDLDAVAEAGRAAMADGEPRTKAELVAAVRERWPDVPKQALGELLVASLIPMVQLPPRGLWRTRAGVRNQTVAAWLGRDVDPLPVTDADADPAEADPVGQRLVRRYLAAYGPATSGDLRAWCGLAGLPAAVKAVRPELVTFRDERGRELLDLPDAPRPDPDTPAPVRFLPAFDNAILGYQDRSRIIDDAHLGVSVAGDRVLLVDGRATATWTVRDHTLHLTPFRTLTAPEREEIHAEAALLSTFLDEDITDLHIPAA
ncbi:winged helix DNA-binding domain-containing protein [Streptomyces sp. Z26]|uniref:winged helix DNA-binding domain-containing protein n=1 Tax=Streptomyces sp. Z26 TaxID=2500177 RepID=UPI000EF16F98|nr:winged helix DNA-binding domain-containing protein [Streptomyces sp. Z26]RLL66044.1 winged helix DNA-binding domain-containing protein [Streptomyces sp. Z26]